MHLPETLIYDDRMRGNVSTKLFTSFDLTREHKVRGCIRAEH